MLQHPVLKVALPTPLRRLFDYLSPSQLGEDQIQPGSRIRVPFGNRKMVGVVVETASSSNLSSNKLKHAESLLDSVPILPDSVMALCKWCAQYYQHPIGEVVSATMPSLLRKGHTDIRHHEIVYRLSVSGIEAKSELKNAPRQMEIICAIDDCDDGISQQALKALGLTGSPLKALLDKGFVIAEQVLNAPQPAPSQILADAPLTLNSDQQNAVTQVTSSLEQFACFLLEGVTGSGKTEVYLQIIEKALEKGQTALVLIPEIGLTPQTLARFKHRFNAPISVLHSNMSEQARMHDWMAAADGHARIVLGTRSAVFAPLPNIGVIIVDEEHDTSFKQQDGFRYCARDVAIMRAHQAQVPIVLGTATPSLESLSNISSSRYQHLELPARASEAQKPTLHLLDIRSRPLTGGLSQPLISAIGKQLSQGNQVLVFINRRGFAPTLMCHQCGWIANCARCDARLTVHTHPQQLRCHHCDAQAALTNACPECGHGELLALGTGTARSEEAIAELFPDTEVIRIDRDSTRNRNAMESIVSRINQARPCILVGTQMIAKGHHFPNVTLAAILEADYGLFSSDFRGLERMGQLITQVAGRAGRGNKQGEVIIQTHQADHPLLQSLVNDGYNHFARQILEEREQAQLPPFRHMALLRAEAASENEPLLFLMQARQLIESANQQHMVDIFGPMPAIMAKRAGRYRAQLSLQAFERKPLHNVLSTLCLQLESLKDARKVRWSIDVDPVEGF